MIADAVLNVVSSVLTSFLSFFCGLMPPVPAFVSDGFAKVGELIPYLGMLDTWVPVSLVMSVGALVVSTWLACIALKIVREVVSYLTLGGGAT